MPWERFQPEHIHILVSRWTPAPAADDDGLDREDICSNLNSFRCHLHSCSSSWLPWFKEPLSRLPYHGGQILPRELRRALLALGCGRVTAGRALHVVHAAATRHARQGDAIREGIRVTLIR